MKHLEPQPCCNPPPQRRLLTHYLRVSWSLVSPFRILMLSASCTWLGTWPLNSTFFLKKCHPLGVAGGGREAQEGGDMCTLVADSRRCTAETTPL